MKVVLLCAGRSFRMEPVSDKNFIDFVGKPLVLHQLLELKAAGAREIIIVGGKHNLKALRKLRVPGLSLSFCEQKNYEKGMAQGVLAALRMAKNGPVLVVCSNDIVETETYRAVLKKEKDKTGFIVGYRVREYFPGGYIKLHKNKTIAEIVEKPKPGRQPSDLVNLVVHLHPDAHALATELQKTESPREDHYERALTALFAQKEYRVIPCKGEWLPIKYPWHVAAAARFFVERTEAKKPAFVAKTASMSGHIVCGENVRVMDHATVFGPAYLGDNTIIGNGALVRESHIGKNCVIGFATEVARSYLGDSVWTHSNYLGDSVIGSNVSFGAGTGTGNLRLDEGQISVAIKGEKMNTGKTKLGLITGNHIRVGINTSFMPGVKIGSHSFIGAGISVAQDIPENSYVRGETALKISKNNVKNFPKRN